MLRKNPPSSRDISELATSWFNIYGKAEKPSKGLYDDVVFSKIREIVRFFPEEFLIFAQILAAKDLSDFAVDVFVSGPLQEFEEIHMPHFSNEVKDLCRQSKSISSLLGW